MPNGEDAGYEYVEIRASKKISITLSPAEVLALAQKKAGAAAAATVAAPQQRRAGTLARLGQQLKEKVFGSKPPEGSR
jgi:hypothetical protein